MEKVGKKQSTAPFWLTILVLGAIAAFFIFQACKIGDYYSIVGKVSNVEYSSGGFGHSDLTTVYFEDNRTLVIHSIVEPITLGRVYNFTFGSSQFSKDIFIGFKEVVP